MKTVMYRIGVSEDNEILDWAYHAFRCNSDTKVTKEMCYRDKYGDYYLKNLYNENAPNLIVEILKEIEDEY